MKPVFYNVLFLVFMIPVAAFAGRLHDLVEIGDIGYLQAYVKSLKPEELKAQLEERDTMGATPLHQAVNDGNLEAVAYLVHLGADREALRSGLTPLEMAKRRRQAAEKVDKEKWALIIKALDFDPEDRPEEADDDDGDIFFLGDLQALSPVPTGAAAAAAAAQALGRSSPPGGGGSW